MKRIKAFTLVEALVVLILTGMSITVLYFIWTYFSKLSQDFESEMRSNIEWVQADEAFRSDKEDAIRSKPLPKGIQFQYEDSSSVNWQLKGSFLFRETDRVDSFKVGDSLILRSSPSTF